VAEVLTASLTVILGFVVFVFGQIAQRFFIEPIQEQRRVIGEIAHVTVYYANVDANVGRFSEPEARLEASDTLRRLAGQLRSTLWTVPRYRLFQFFRLVKERERVLTASNNLIGWSNVVISASDRASFQEQRQAIIEALDLPPA
jgi:hypothetical protein